MKESELPAMYGVKEIMVNGKKVHIPVRSDKCKAVYHGENESLVQAKIREGVPLDYEEIQEGIACGLIEKGGKEEREFIMCTKVDI